MDSLVFAYYCSGHGYGHATRVSAFARHLLSLPLGRGLTIHIVSSAPRHVFADSIACGALYRYADIDPVIVQPLAYRVDRLKSIQVLEDFLGKKAAMLDRERAWLSEIGASCVLSDAAFLGCLAAKSTGIPSILITNFTFDSVYSYLATSFVDSPAQAPITPSSSTLSPSPSTATDTSISSTDSNQLLPDIPIPEPTLAPLVSQLHDGYQHADLLLRLPGHIPIPSFFSQPALPSPQWIDPALNKLYAPVRNHLQSHFNPDCPLHPPKPFPSSDLVVPRSVRAAPLLVRPPSPAIYTPEGRADFLRKTGLPDFQGMKILVVSFGGQVFKRPGGSRTNSRMQSRFPSQETLALDASTEHVTEKKHSSHRFTRECHTFHRTSASLDKLALRPRDLNTTNLREHISRLDLDALDKGLRTHNKFKSSEVTKHDVRQIKKTSKYPDENTSDYISSDADNEASGHSESDQEPISNKDSDALFSHDRTPTPARTTEIAFGGAATLNTTAITDLAKRRHTLPRRRHHSHDLNAHRRCLATSSHLLIPGAPPASKPSQTLLRTPSLGKSRVPRVAMKLPEMCIIPPTPQPSVLSGTAVCAETSVDTPKADHLARFKDSDVKRSAVSPVLRGLDQGHSSGGIEQGKGMEVEGEGEGDIGLLPDENWIAVICGVSKEQWNAENEEGGLPDGFYVAPRDVYMPDLIAAGDVVLGKLGYGMTSECVDACTPFVYVSRPLFIEEHGLRMYLDQEGVGIELSRIAYEGGEWARSVEEAYSKGWEIKDAKRKKEYDFCMKLKMMDQEGVEVGDERRLSERERQGRDMARGVVEWVDGVREVMRGKKEREWDIVGSQARLSEVPRPILSVEFEAKGIMVA